VLQKAPLFSAERDKKLLENAIHVRLYNFMLFIYNGAISQMNFCWYRHLKEKCSLDTFVRFACFPNHQLLMLSTIKSHLHQRRLFKYYMEHFLLRAFEVACAPHQLSSRLDTFLIKKIILLYRGFKREN